MPITTTTGAAAATIPLSLRVTNCYITGEHFCHDLIVQVEPPAGDLYEWACNHLMHHTGEGPEYADTEASYFIEVTGTPPDHQHLLGMEFSTEG